MRGSLKRRYKGSWSIILDLESASNASGAGKRKQKWITFHGTKKQAETKLNELVGAANGDTFVEPSKLTLIAWLREWFEAKKGEFAPATYVRYHGIIENHLSHATIAALPLQKVRASHLERYYATATGSKSSLALHHTVLLRALRTAKRDQLVSTNIAADLEGRPRRSKNRSEDAREHCWTASEAQTFLTHTASVGAQNAAFYALALDSGARKNELCGLGWSDVDLDAGKIHVVRQLLKAKQGVAPTFGPPKGKRPRTITLSAETVALLKTHKQQQSELKMRHRPTYQDFGLVFAKEFGELYSRKDLLGHPLQSNNLGERSFDRLRTAAGVRRIKFHGLRHTCATLLLLNGVAVHVVSQRLGHANVQTTLDTYAHVLPDAQQDAADRLAAVLRNAR